MEIFFFSNSNKTITHGIHHTKGTYLATDEVGIIAANAKITVITNKETNFSWMYNPLN